MKLQRLCLTLIILLFSQLITYSQEFPISMEGVQPGCIGAFLDSGSAAAGYGPGENFTITFCPEEEGDAVFVQFLSVDINCPNNNNCDQLIVYDGDNTSANSMGSVNDAITYTASPLNNTGCLTFQFTSNGSGEGMGWSASLTCETPCDRPYAEASTSPGGEMPIKVCIDDVISFDGSASTVAEGQQMDVWLWDFRDGTTDETSGPITSHSYDQAGEYIVQLYLIDDNDCASTNRTDIQIWVSTEPNWIITPPLGLSTCLGDTLALELDVDTLPVTWDAQPTIDLGPGTPVPDIVGACFGSEFEFNGFAPGQTLNDIDDLQNIFVNFEHSFMGDLLIQIICPDGTTVNLHEQGGGGTNLGEANQADDGVPGIGWDYWWSDTATNGTWEAESGDAILPSGTYSPVGDLSDLVGCPLNGVWSLSMCDLWGADDGTVFEWTINFNPDLYPDLTQFTPIYGPACDSTYWTGPNIYEQDAGCDTITVVADTTGFFDYTITVINDFGCTFDSTITISIYQAQAAYAGEDLIYCGEDDVLQGGLDNVSGGSCNNDGGDYTYCYSDGDNTTFTYCPDEMDGTTMMTIEFFEGQIENMVFDQLTIYDGSTTTSPVLAAIGGTTLNGLTYTASNNGCLTMSITSDGSVSCNGGSFLPMEYTLSCGVASDYIFNWTPEDNVSDVSIPNPNILQLGLDNLFILEVWPEDHYACATTDTVEVLPAFDFNITPTPPTCMGNNGIIDVIIDANNNTPPWFITVTQDGNTIYDITTNGGLESLTDFTPGDYEITVGNDQCTYAYPINMPDVVPSVILTMPDTIICIGGTVELEAWSMEDPDNSWQYIWDNNLNPGSSVTDNPLESTTYTVYGIDDYDCETAPLEVLVEIHEPLSVTITEDTLVCDGGTVVSEVLTSSGGLGNFSYEWEYNNSNIDTGEDITYSTINPGTLCAIITDECETPQAIACLEVSYDEVLDVQITSDVVSGCIPLKVNFSIANDSSLFDQTFWNLGDNLVMVNQNSFPHSYSLAGSYDIDLTLTSNIGCDYKGYFNNYIQVYNNPIAGFYATPQPTKIPDSKITFHDISIDNIVSYYWIIDSIGLNEVFTIQNPVYEFPSNYGGSYEVYLEVMDNNGCKNDVTHTIVIDEVLNIFVPSAFSPNGDGINDYFYVRGTDIDPKNYHLEIFNRWGSKVYETKDVDDVWVGEKQNGEYYYLQNEVYVWRIVTYSNSTLERIELSGSLTILR